MRELHIAKIVTFWYKKRNEFALKLFGNNRDGEQDEIIVYGFKPYFYAPADECEEQRMDLVGTEGVLNLEDGFESLFDDPVTKITVDKFGVIRDLEDRFSTTYEAEVRPEERFRIDFGVYSGIRVPEKAVHYRDVEPIDFEGTPRVLTFDIETDDRGSFPKLGEKRIISVVAHDSEEGDYIGFIDLNGREVGDVFPDGKPVGLDLLNFYATEKQMLEGFAEFVSERNPDLFTGWNIERFDMPYLIRRMDSVNCPTRKLSRTGYVKIHDSGKAPLAVVGGRTVYDMLPAYKRTQRGELESYRLDAVAAHELGESKLDHAGEGIYEMWQNDCDKLMRYNFHDVRLVVEIDETAGVLKFNNALRMDVGVDFDMTSANHNFIDMMVRRKLFKWGKVAPTTNFAREKGRKYTGAHVVDAYTGLAKNVVGMDLASLYPYTIAQLNASPEVRLDVDESDIEWSEDTGEAFVSLEGEMVPVSVAPNGTVFRLDEEGLFTSLVNEAIDLKAAFKKRKKSADPASSEYDKLSVQYDVRKTIVNSLYGVMGWVYFFLYDEPTAEAVTTMGQVVIKKTQSFINSTESASVIYGDTDSNYVKFPDEWDRDTCIARAKAMSLNLNETVYPKLAKKWGMGQRDCKWDLEVENYAPTFFQAGKKKRYAMRVTWEEGRDTDKVKITGFDTNRSDTSQLTNDLMKDVLEAIIYEKSNGEIVALVNEYGEKVSSSPVEYVAIPQGISKALHLYDSKTESIRGAENANKIMGTNFGAGSKPMRIRIVPKFFEEAGVIDVISFEEPEDLPDEIIVDADEMMEKDVYKPVSKILPAVGIDTRAALSGHTQTGLAEFV